MTRDRPSAITFFVEPWATIAPLSTKNGKR